MRISTQYTPFSNMSSLGCQRGKRHIRFSRNILVWHLLLFSHRRLFFHFYDSRKTFLKRILWVHKFHPEKSMLWWKYLWNDIKSLLMFQKQFWTYTHFNVEQKWKMVVGCVVTSHHAHEIGIVKSLASEHSRIGQCAPHFSGEIISPWSCVSILTQISHQKWFHCLQWYVKLSFTPAHRKS